LPSAVWTLDHDTFEKFDTPVGEQRSEITRVLEVDDVWNLLGTLPAVKSIESILSVRLFGVGRGPD
jgi:hypothetical protein